MKIIRKNTKLIIENDQNEKYYDDSQLLYHIKNELIKKGYDVIKKLACKDGHLVSDTLYYIRDRKKRWYIHDSDYMIRFAYKDFNQGRVVLDITGEMER
jgi:hypothetical protein